MTDYYPIELFHWAGMKDAHIEELIDILKSHPEYVNETNELGDNCLFIAARTGNIEMVKYIVENTDINIHHLCKDQDGQPDGNALLAALSTGKGNIAEYFIENTEIDIYSQNSRGENVYHLCAGFGNADLIEKLLERDTKNTINNLSKDNRNCLFNLIESYRRHKDYYCFELVQEKLTNEVLFHRDVLGQNIIDFAEELERKELKLGLKSINTPLINILKSRL